MNIASHLKSITKQLTAVSSTPELDAIILLEFVLTKTRAYLYAHSEEELTQEQEKLLAALVERRSQGEPIAYIIGKREFWSLELGVNNSVLIPRPDTELIVELTLKYLPKTKAIVADLGTGSGAIALALAKERPDWKIVATDKSKEALAIAKHNAATNNIDNVEFYSGNWCDAIPNLLFDAIVANPPYIAANDPHLTQGDVRFEPKTALISDQDGLQDITTIIQQARKKLKSGGIILLEHGFDQAGAVKKLLQQNGFCNIETHQDLAGNDRVTLGITKQ